jgi:hypothetical protein
VLPSTTAGVSALGTLPAVSASGAVPAALAAGTTGAAAAAPAYGPLAGGYGAATTEASIPPALAATGATAGGVGSTLSSLLPKAIPAAANIIGNQIQKGAINNAVNAQVGSQEKALEAERLGGERAIGILAPWANVGGAAANRLGELLHLQPPPAVPGQMPVTPAQQSSANSFVPNAVRNSPTASQVSQAPGPYANWPIYQAPDGSKRRVDPSQAQAAEAAGATRVG